MQLHRLKPDAIQRLARIIAVAGFFLLVSLPVLVQISGLWSDNGARENRILAPAPRWSGRLSTLFLTTNAWLDDHFGLRRPLVDLANDLRFSIFAESGNPQIAFGRDRELFLTSHNAAEPQQMLFLLCRGAGDEAWDRSLAAQLARFLDAALRRDARTVELVVPTKTVIDEGNLPGWMRASCNDGQAMLPRMLSALGRTRPDLRSHVAYPLALMQSLHGPDAPYPKVNFHWDGPALGIIAAMIAEQRFHRRRLTTLKLRVEQKNSDIAHLLPGVRLPFETIEPDLAASAIGSSVQIPELGASGIILADTSRFRKAGPSSGPRLLIISDSFGQPIAPWFAAFYGEVWHVSVNNLPHLARAQRSALVDTLFNHYRPDDVLLVFHDFSQAYVNTQLVHLLWGIP